MLFAFLNNDKVLAQQSAQVEQSTFGVQVALGAWTYAELGLTDQIALRSEFGFDSGIFGSSVLSRTVFVLFPVLSLEPKWYYNFEKRAEKSTLSDNNADYLSINLQHHPDWFTIGDDDGVILIKDVSVMATWGIRRNIGKHFNYEIGLGFGYRYLFAKDAGFRKDEDETFVHIKARIGYRFKF